MERWEAFAVIFCVHPVPVFLRISGIPLSASRFCFLENVALGAREEKQHAVWGNGNPDDRIDIVVFPVDGFWGDGFPRDISFGVHYRYENRVVHHHIEVEDAELVEQNAWYKDEGRCHIKQNVAGSVSQG